MNRTILELVRKVSHANETFSIIYSILSDLKAKKNRRLDDETYFKKRYRSYVGKDLILDNPQTFNEKLLWLQIHDHNPLYTKLADKYLVKKNVADTIGEKYVTPLIGVWNSADEIPFEKLPNEYVLKCNHDCGSVFIKRSGDTVNEKKIRKKFNKALKRNYYDVGRVWSYKNIKPLVFCEELISTKDGKVPKDYKIFCFDGEPKFAFVASNRGEDTKFDFYDMNWNRIPVKQHYPNSKLDIPKPEQFNEMVECARKLSKNIPQVRVDFYIDANGNVIFGEMTFCHFSGKEPFEPEEYDSLFGKYIKLPKI
ncbi:MAG TPA: ATP-grasp fold amidoligase family protein [Clostridiales bacterium]|nr:ATP-grasp fold amidoligase family protein [Clostridiales bacterium]